MRMGIASILIIASLLGDCLFAQSGRGKSYRIDRNKSIYLPLGKISFADKLIAYKVGSPSPKQIYRDSIQCLHEPNYTSYSIPDFISLGCGGSLTVQFTDNGLMNLKGDDIYIFEVASKKESSKIEVSTNGKDWIYAGKVFGGTSKLDLSDEHIDSYTVFYFLRVTDLKDLCKSKSAGADIDAIGAINSVIKLTVNADLLFDVADYSLKESAEQILDTLVKTIRLVDKATISVEGHTDNDGGDAYNLELSKNRCRTVVEKLITIIGYKSYDYEVIAFGERLPKVDNNSPENKQINRRVEITILPPKDYFESIREKN